VTGDAPATPTSLKTELVYPDGDVVSSSDDISCEEEFELYEGKRQVRLSWTPEDAPDNTYYKIEFLIDGEYEDGTAICAEYDEATEKLEENECTFEMNNFTDDNSKFSIENEEPIRARVGAFNTILGDSDWSLVYDDGVEAQTVPSKILNLRG